jgi:hypothetical protein
VVFGACSGIFCRVDETRAGLGRTIFSNSWPRATHSLDSDRGLLTELRNVVELLSLDNQAAITLATDTTARWIFPDSKIGALADGFEASSLVLEINPLEDLAALENIQAWVKFGHALEIASKVESHRSPNR